MAAPTVARPEAVGEVLALVRRYMAAFEAMDADGMVATLSRERITISYPFHESGLTKPGAYRSHAGFDHVASYLRGEGEHVGFERYTRLRFLDQVYRPVADASSVYLEAMGDHLMTDGSSYENRFVFRFDVEDGSIVEIVQYHNPVTSLVPYGRA